MKNTTKVVLLLLKTGNTFIAFYSSLFTIKPHKMRNFPPRILRISFCLIFIFAALASNEQGPQSAYYYQGQQIPVTLSEKIMFVKFINGTTNSQKQSLITQAQVDLRNADWNAISDVVQLKSRILQHLVWVYPCGIPPVDNPVKKNKDTLKKDTLYGVQGCSPPCPPPPGDCTPYQVWQNYDNFYEALFFFGDNASVRSASKAVFKSTTDTIATCEDFFIKIKSGYTINDFSSLISYYSLTASDASADFGAGVYKISESRGGSRFCIERANIFYGTGMCDFSIPNFYEFHSTLTNDPLWSQQWGLLNTGQYNGISGADIRVVPAWAFTQGNNIKVAVVDEGVQLDHPDLQANILTGYDAIANVAGGGPIGIKDSHGTSCAGIIGAIADNNIGISGIAPQSKIIPIRAFSDNYGGGSTESIARAINWASSHGADIISNSYKWDSESDLIDNAIINAATTGRGSLGCVIVYASGNSGNQVVKYPGRLPATIAVGNMSMCNQRANPQSCDDIHSYGSNYGVDLDLMAPGMKIATLDIGGGTTTDFSGTSAACPHVAGVAALVLSANPNLTLEEVRRILQYSCNKVGSYCYNWTSNHPDGPWNDQMGYGRINAYNAVQLALRATSFSNPVYDLSSQSNSLVSNNYYQLIVLNSGCSSLPSSVYIVQRYEVTTNINYSNTSNPLIICNSNGWSAANPNEGKNFATAINITSTSATLKTWVYKGYNTLGQFIGWFPTSPENVKFNYTIIGANSNIDYQLLRATNNISNINLTGPIPYQFDEQGPSNDRIVSLYKNKLFVNPNPGVNTVYLTCDLMEGERISTIDILNINGQFIQKVTLSSKNPVQNIDISKLKSGIYFLRVITNKGVYNKSIIKKYNY